MSLSTHVLDTSLGRPAPSVGVTLEILLEDDWTFLSHGFTDPDGRIRDLVPEGMAFEEGIYRLVFETASYFEQRQVEAFYPEVMVVFRVSSPGDHHHVPLLLSPFGYATYRGS